MAAPRLRGAEVTKVGDESRMAAEPAPLPFSGGSVSVGCPAPPLGLSESGAEASKLANGDLPALTQW